LALLSKQNPNLTNEQFCERVEGALSTFDIDLRDTNIHRMTMRDILAKQKLTKAIEIVDKQMKEQ